MWTLSSKLQTFIQCGDFYPAKSLLSVEISAKFEYFYQVWKLLSNVETFMQCGDF